MEEIQNIKNFLAPYKPSAVELLPYHKMVEHKYGALRMEMTSFSVHFTTYEPIDTDTFFIKINKTNEVIRMLELLEKEFLSRRCELHLMSDFYNFCAYYNKIYQKTIVPKDMRMQTAESYINAHFTESDCLTKAFENSGLSRRRFNDLFKNCFDITPNRYIINLKIDYAKKLLQTEYINISQTAEICGFSDIYYFSRLFKKETGQTPAEYRKRTHAQL